MMEQQTNQNSVTLSHGILTEDFKQNILNMVQSHPLDIQTKVIILDSVLMSANIIARQQTQKELEEYQKSQNKSQCSSDEDAEKEVLS